eukprot:XP_019926734.1 PREDICTED: uncharacterized protein LOC109619913 [Crassostrea gigas]
MVLRCAWGTCNVAERYPERLQNGVKLILFPKPKTNLQKCIRSIKACGRPHEQLNIQRINKHKAVCSKHFVGGNGPTVEFPDPLQADGSAVRPTRPPRKRTSTFTESNPVSKKKKLLCTTDIEDNGEDVNSITETETSNNTSSGNNISIQTEEPWISPFEMFAMVTELQV